MKGDYGCARRHCFPVALMAALVLSCSVVKPGPGAPEDKLRAVARQLLDQLPAKSRVVVSNFTRLGGGQGTMLGVYLAKRFGVALAAAAGSRLTIIDRELGTKSVMEEMRFTVDRQSAKELLEHFRADYAVMATYDLGRGGCALELVELKAVSTTGAEVPFAGGCLLPGTTDDYAYWQRLEGQQLPNMNDKLQQFVVKNGDWNAVEDLRLELASGSSLPASGELAIDSRVRVNVKLGQACYLYVFTWDQSHARMNVLFPSPQKPALAGPGEIAIPGSGFFRAYGPAGYNWVKAVATKHDLEFTVTDSSSVDAQALENLADRILALGSADWGARTFGYWNVEK